MGLRPKYCGHVHRENQNDVVVFFLFLFHPSGVPVCSTCGRFIYTRKLDVEVKSE